MKPSIKLAALAAGLLIAGPALAQGDPTALVRRAVDAAGGTAALHNVRTVTLQGTAKHWEPEQSVLAGGETRFVDDAKITITLDVPANAARVDWDRSFQYPAVLTEKYSTVMADGVGYVTYPDGKPADRAMSGNRLAAERRELTRASPVFLLGMLDHPEHLRAMAKQRVDGKDFDSVGYRLGMVDYVVMFDGPSHRPARLRLRDADPPQWEFNLR